MSDERASVIALMGPTASGKTGFASRLVERFNVEIISVDSAMVYRGMDIGTAKPDAAELARAPHRMIDLCDPADSYSAGRFRRDALREIEALHAQGRVPLLAGGTMLYFRALLHGLDELPDADPAVRRAIDERAADVGWPALHAELAVTDPAAAARIHPNDSQRIQRALEVHQCSGVTLSEWHASGEQEAFPYRLLKIALIPSRREALHARIEARFEQMLRAGFVEEVRRLHARGDLDAGMSAMRAVGYRQILAHLNGELTLDEAVRSAVTATRRLAKRQLTWLRKEPDLNVVDPLAPDAMEKIFTLVAQWGRYGARSLC